MGDEEERMTQELAPEDVGIIPEVKYEFLDHPADVQIHAWGDSLREAYEQAAMAMFAYMTEIDTVDMLEAREIEAEAEDLEGLLFHFLDECLFVFSCEPFFIARKVVITKWEIGNGGGSGDGEEGSSVGGGGEGVFKAHARLFGEEFQLEKHPQGTEVKAITYASMQVYDNPNQHEVFVIIDI